MDFGKIIMVDPRDVWRDEREFIGWLADNISYLSECIGLDLEVSEVESEVSGFRADIVARDRSKGGLVVVIEAQLSRTDHEHLGKLITYAAGKDASVIVWISPEFREEHRSALDWLNNLSDDVIFFGVELEVLRINGSKPAPRFNIVSQPNEWRRFERARMVLSEREMMYREFFRKLADRLRAVRLANVRRSYRNGLSFGAGRSGFWYDVIFTGKGKLRVGLNFDLRDFSLNMKAFRMLMEEKDIIEKEVGFELEWQKPSQLRRTARIVTYYPEQVTIEDISEDPEVEEMLIAWIVDVLKKFRNAITPRVQSLRL